MSWRTCYLKVMSHPNTIPKDRDEPSQAIMEFVMNVGLPHRPHPPAHDDPDPFEPGSLPVQPDEGQVPPGTPDDPEHDHFPAK